MYKFMGLLVFSLLMSCQSKAQTNTEQKKPTKSKNQTQNGKKFYRQWNIMCCVKLALKELFQVR